MGQEKGQNYSGEAMPEYSSAETLPLIGGVLVDATKAYPAVCKLARMRNRVLVTLTCWVACIAPPGTVSLPGAEEATNLFRLLGQFSETANWTPPGQPLHFEADVDLGDGLQVKMGVDARVTYWDGDPRQRVLLLKLDTDG